MYDLGILARVGSKNGKPSSGSLEHVAPVIFYHRKPPKAIDAYLFTFKPNRDLSLLYTLFYEKENAIILKGKLPFLICGRPFTIRLKNFSKELRKEGIYIMKINGRTVCR